MTEKQIPIVQKGEFKNIEPKQELDPQKGEYIIFKKLYNEGKEIEGKYGISYVVSVQYRDEQVSFFLSPYQHDKLVKVAGIDEKVKMTACLEERKGGFFKSFNFEKVE